jgi:hypothetical protein
MTREANQPKMIKIAVEFEVREDLWLKLPVDLGDKGKLALTGIYELTPADIVAFLVMGTALSTPNDKGELFLNEANRNECTSESGQ